MKKHFDYFIRSWIDFIFLRPLPGMRLIKWGVTLILATFAGFALTVGIPTENGRIDVSFDSGAGIPAFVLALVLTLASLMIIGGALWLFVDLRRESRKQVLAIELRGLRDMSGQPLISAVPTGIMDRRVSLLLDIRQGADGVLLSPEQALARLESLPHMIHQSSTGRDRRDLTVVAGGMAAVPFAFLMGVLLDDEGRVTLLDWDRAQECWRGLDEPDDGERLVLTGLETVGDASEVVVAVSVSYPEDRVAIAHRFPGLPVIRLGLSAPTIDHHWSAAKQAAWAQQFFDLARQLCATNVRQVHLVLVAPTSVVINFGRSYDKRNLPALTVYQYENGSPATYPWGIKMPVANAPGATLVRS